MKYEYKYIISFITCIIITIVSYIYITEYFSNKSFTVSHKEQVTVTDIKKDIKDATSNTDKKKFTEKELDNISKDINKEISKARDNSTTPIYTSSSIITAKDASKIDSVKKEKPTLIIDEPSSSHTGTNIYSIRIRKAEHGVGLYTGYKDSASSSRRDNVEFGIHYRNKRWIYQAGADLNGRLNGRIVYEVIQW